MDLAVISLSIVWAVFKNLAKTNRTPKEKLAFEKYHI